jgi:ATP-grasp ribosomal peptide maturase
MKDTVLIVTHWFDPTADLVIDELGRRAVPLVRFDAADFPRCLTFDAMLGPNDWHGTIKVRDRSVALGEVSGIYFRRPTKFDFGSMPPDTAKWALSEARIGFGGVLMASDRWLNHPHRNGYAEFKPVQLAEASRVGLSVPETIITNDPEKAKAFAEEVGEIIYKPMSPAILPQGSAQGSMLYASVVTPADLAASDGIASTAHMFQQRVKHDYAIRLTVIDENMFAVAIHAHSHTAALDWRSDYNALTYEVIQTPPDVRHRISKLMKVLQLRFGAFDFLCDPDHGWIFLEVNPNGQWAWIEQATGLPISSAIADALTVQEKS